MITQKILKELLSYDHETGIFTWIVSPAKCIKIGDVAGTLENTGYIRIRIKGKKYLSHKLVWLYMQGFVPHRLDHKDQCRTNNKYSNLRVSTQSQNGMNQGANSRTSTKLRGVFWDKLHKKYRAQCTANKKRFFLGYFETAELASLAYKQFAIANHGEFFNGKDCV